MCVFLFRFFRPSTFTNCLINISGFLSSALFETIPFFLFSFFIYIHNFDFVFCFFTIFFVLAAGLPSSLASPAQKLKIFQRSNDGDSENLNSPAPKVNKATTVTTRETRSSSTTSSQAPPPSIYMYISLAHVVHIYIEKKNRNVHVNTLLLHSFFTCRSSSFTYTYRFIKAIFILLSIFISFSLFIHLLLYCRHHLYRATRTQREGGSDKPADNALSVVYIYASLSLSSLSSSS